MVKRAVRKDRKKTQHAFNHIVRSWNKSLENDELWKGRFVIHQINAGWERFSDNSGDMLYPIVRIYDKKTHKMKDMYLEYGTFLKDSEWKLYLGINHFIVEDVNVWSEDPRPDAATATDWTKVKVPKGVFEYHKGSLAYGVTEYKEN